MLVAGESEEEMKSKDAKLRNENGNEQSLALFDFPGCFII